MRLGVPEINRIKKKLEGVYSCTQQGLWEKRAFSQRSTYRQEGVWCKGDYLCEFIKEAVAATYNLPLATDVCCPCKCYPEPLVMKVVKEMLASGKTDYWRKDEKQNYVDYLNRELSAYHLTHYPQPRRDENSSKDD